MSAKMPYEWMVKYTPQTEWVEGRGIIFWLAFFFVELGAGMFFVSSLFGSLPGQWIGWLICAVLGGGFHLLYLGHPMRFYRMVLRPQTSWVSRGLIFVFAFLILGGVEMIFSLQGTPSLGLLAVADGFAFLTVIYGGFAMNYIAGIPFWNTALLPVLYAVAGFWGGAGLTMAVLLNTGGLPEAVLGVEEVSRGLLVVFVVIFPTYLIAARYGLPAGKASARRIAVGRLWPLFWIVVVFLGLVVPVGVVLFSLVVGLKDTPSILLYLSILFELSGDLFLRYLILKNGLYSPLLPAPEYWLARQEQ